MHAVLEEVFLGSGLATRTTARLLALKHLLPDCDGMAAGEPVKYVLGWRYGCEATARVRQDCADAALA